HRVLIEALSRMRLKVPWECWFVGGAQRPEEEQYALELKDRVAVLGLDEQVRFLGARKDVAVILADADVYCQPNDAPEAFGLTFVEALRASLPVVTTNI